MAISTLRWRPTMLIVPFVRRRSIQQHMTKKSSDYVDETKGEENERVRGDKKHFSNGFGVHTKFTYLRGSQHRRTPGYIGTAI